MILAIEDAIIARIQAASDAGTLGYTFRTVASYGGEFDDEDFRVSVRQFPAAWVVYSGERDADMGDARVDADADFVVMVGAQSHRNEAASRRGDGTEPGTYQLVKDVKAILTGQTLGLEIDPLAPAEVRSLFNGQVRKEQLSVFAIRFSTKYGEAGTPDAPIDDFTHFHADWDVPVFAGHVSVPVPAGDADAVDDVNLPGAP